MNYNDGFKARMVKRLAVPGGISATALSQEVGVPQSTLSRWLRDARTLPPMGGADNKREGKAKSPRQWTPEEKLRVVVEASGVSESDLGAFLRRHGIHAAQLKEWQEVAVQALSGPSKGARRRKPSPEAKLVKELQRELRRKDKALAEVTALLALKKKLEAIWGDEDDDTPTRSGT